MLGRMDMAVSVDEFSMKHGNMMIADGQSLMTEIMESKVMMDMHASGKTPEKDSKMKMTHTLAESAIKLKN
jgi:hypothetical protein